MSNAGPGWPSTQISLHDVILRYVTRIYFSWKSFGTTDLPPSLQRDCVWRVLRWQGRTEGGWSMSFSPSTSLRLDLRTKMMLIMMTMVTNDEDYLELKVEGLDTATAYSSHCAPTFWLQIHINGYLGLYLLFHISPLFFSSSKTGQIQIWKIALTWYEVRQTGWACWLVGL